MMLGLIKKRVFCCDYQAAFYPLLRGFLPFSAVCPFTPGIAYLFILWLCATDRNDSGDSWDCYIPGHLRLGFKSYALRVCRMLHRHFHSDQECKPLPVSFPLMLPTVFVRLRSGRQNCCFLHKTSTTATIYRFRFHPPQAHSYFSPFWGLLVCCSWSEIPSG